MWHLRGCLHAQIVEGRPAELEQETDEEEVSLLAGHMQEDVAATNQKPLLMGLLKVSQSRF
jgi:hypothetical protein